MTQPPPPFSHQSLPRPDDDRPAPPSTDTGTALTALILAMLPFVVTTLIGFVMSIVVLARGRRTAGWGMALAALIISTLWFIVGAVVLVASLSQVSQQRDDSGDLTEPQSISSTSLRVGDCTAELPTDGEETELTDVDAVPCDQPHRTEVYASFELDGDTFPGQEDVFDLAEQGCIDRYEGFVGTPYDESSLGLYYLTPLQDSWRLGDRMVTCLLIVEDDRRGTLEDSGL